MAPGAVQGRVEVGENVAFALREGEAWAVVLNGVEIDHVPHSATALSLVGRLARALRAGEPEAASMRPARLWNLRDNAPRR
jgi:hypothetical protein